jgi:hypothetical protein
MGALLQFSREEASELPTETCGAGTRVSAPLGKEELDRRNGWYERYF